MLQQRSNSLSELRLQSCGALDIGPNAFSATERSGIAGLDIVATLKRLETNSMLAILDVRGCGGRSNNDRFLLDTDEFVSGLLSLGFDQKVAGFFSRPARWSQSTQDRLVQEYLLE